MAWDDGQRRRALDHSTRRSTITRRALCGGLAAAAAATPVHAGGFRPAPAPLRAVIEAMVIQDGAPGVRLLSFRGLQPLYEATLGDIDARAAIPVASASKWMAAALVMTVVDEGRLSLDAPVRRFLPFDAGASGDVTLRQLLSFTSGHEGIAGFADVRQPPGIDLMESARRITLDPLEARAGARFAYGSGGLQIAGAMVEHVTGRRWTALFDEQLARPLGLKQTRWSHPLAFNRPGMRVRNPNLQAGLITSADDYGRFLTLIAGMGAWRGRRLLSPDAVREMERVQTLAALWPDGETAVGGQAVGYNLGAWCEARDGDRCLSISSPGAFGTYPWIDRRSGDYGVFLMRHRYPRVAGRIAEARRILATL